MANRDVVSARFRIALANRLKSRFGKVISAQRFSDLYNLNAYDSTTISRETARLWIRGNAMPDYGHLAVLVQWLGIKPEEFLGKQDPSPQALPEDNPSTHGDNRNQFKRDLLALWDELDPETRKTVLVVAVALSAQKNAGNDSTAGLPDMGAVIAAKAKLPTKDWQM